MQGLYYGTGRRTLGPYHPDEISARVRAVRELESDGAVYLAVADTFEQAARRITATIAQEKRR